MKKIYETRSFGYKRNMAEEEVVGEIEALQAVYGDDCLLLQTYPVSFHLHIKPRTADDSSQQVISITETAD